MAVMLTHPQFDPVALQLGPVSVHWYGITYLVAFALFLLLTRWRLRHAPYAQQPEVWNPVAVEDLLFHGVLGVVLGGRLGYCLFYKPDYYFSHPLEVLAIGRIGNFINGELWGRPADPQLPWAMVFPQSGQAWARHPSQLYQFAMEGLLLFALLWLLARKPRPVGLVSGAFLLGYGVFRFVAEYFREPDAFLGLLSLGLSMGQWLCLPMIALGVWLVWRNKGIDLPTGEQMVKQAK